MMTLNERLSNFLADYECVAVEADEFSYEYATNTIYYTTKSVEGEKEFLASVERLNPTVKLSAFVWSILHELGHNETLDFISDRIIKADERTKRAIANGKVDASKYYDLTVEREATEWAVDFANNNYELVKGLE